VKIENWSRKNHVSISSDFVYDSVAHDLVKTRLSESEEAEEPTNHKTMAEIKDNTSVQKRYKTNKQTLALLFVAFYFGVSALSDRRAIPSKQSPSESFSEAIP